MPACGVIKVTKSWDAGHRIVNVTGVTSLRTKEVSFVAITLSYPVPRELMQLTRAADYAIRVMIHLSTLPEGIIVPKGRLAKAVEVPESFLSKILQTLARSGMIQARRGVDGGFSLLERGANATLLEVVEVIDGPIVLNICITEGTSCSRHPQCPAHQVWMEAQKAMLAVLSAASIATLASGAAGGLVSGPSSGVNNLLPYESSPSAPQGITRCTTLTPTPARGTTGAAAKSHTQHQLKIME